MEDGVLYSKDMNRLIFCCEEKNFTTATRDAWLKRFF